MARTRTTHQLAALNDFLDGVHAAKHKNFKAKSFARVVDEAAFREMQAHIASLYEGVTAEHSFIDANGQIFDCIPVERQPSLVSMGLNAPAKTPELPDTPDSAAADESVVRLESPLREDFLDSLGNRVFCPEGLIPFRRITLEELTRSETVDRFLKKSPIGRGGAHPAAGGTAAPSHKYAHASQSVNNLGGHSFLNIWKPTISGDQVFSLSQHWYSAGPSTAIQTVEAGWQVYPGKYTNSNPVLFIYWTADGYQNTGCYNLDCKAFVQTSSTWPLGGALTNLSTTGGTQAEIEIAWYLSGGNWWLYINSGAIGYYPATQYGAGQLATYATGIDYGGETCGSTSWPPMGSGAFANQGYKQAAYHRSIYYTGLDTKAYWATLTASQPSPSCYTIAVTN